MKHILRLTALLVVAFALTLAGTVGAYAVWGDSTYASWRDISAAMFGESPHGDYDTTSQKCKVCHSVHNAKPSGEKLLRSSVADACSYCHITNRVSDYVVYAGVEAKYTGIDLPNAHNTGVSGTLQGGCSDCHTVHAAYNLMTANIGLSGEDLGDKLLSGAKTQGEPFTYDEIAGAPRFDDSYDTAMSKWCTKCHMFGAGGAGTGDYAYYEPTIRPWSGSHVMKNASDTYALMSGETTRVAWSTSEQCSSCHTSQYKESGSHAWPHYTEGARFLVSADPYSAVTTTAVQPGKTKMDGVCLRCHRNTTRGVGVTW